MNLHIRVQTIITTININAKLQINDFHICLIDILCTYQVKLGEFIKILISAGFELALGVVQSCTRLPSRSPMAYMICKSV